MSSRLVSLSHVAVLAALAVLFCPTLPRADAADNSTQNDNNTQNKNDNQKSDNSGSKGLSAADASFINYAYNVNDTEVRLGTMAMTKATDKVVRDFGKKMVDEHTKLGDELRKFARDHDGALPTALDERHQKLIDKLSNLSGTEFNRAYIDAMIRGHDKTLAAFQKVSNSKNHDATAQWAGQQVAMLKDHLKQAEKIGKQIGAPAAIEGGAQQAAFEEHADQNAHSDQTKSDQSNKGDQSTDNKNDEKSNDNSDKK